MHDPMTRRCSECGDSIAHRRADALTCGGACRVRRRRRLGPPIPHRAIPADAPAPQDRCGTCGDPIGDPPIHR